MINHFLTNPLFNFSELHKVGDALYSFIYGEFIWRMNKPWHIGLIVSADSQERVLELLDAYTHRISNEFHASAPAPDASV